MNYENFGADLEEFSSTSWRENSQYPPLYFHESSYVPGNFNDSFTPCYCGTPECSSFIYQHPESHLANNIGASSRYHSYHPHFPPLNHRDARGHRACPSFYDDGRAYGPETNQKSYHPQMNNQHHLKMYPQAYMRKPDPRINNLKPNLKRKRRSNNGKNRHIPGNIPSAPSTENDKSLQNSQCGIGNVPKHIQDNQLLMQGKDAVQNEPIDFQTECFLNNFAEPDGLNYAACEITNTTVNTTNLHEEVDNHLSNENDMISGNAVMNRQDLNTLPNEHKDPRGAPAEKISTDVSNNSNSGIENTDMESYTLQPLFEGKDVNGEDIIVLLAEEIPEVTQEVPSNVTAETVKKEMRDNHDFANDLAENKTVNHENCSEFTTEEQQTNQEEQNKQNFSDVFFISDIDDYASEEIVKTSRNKCPNVKKNTQNTNLKKNQKILVQKQGKKRKQGECSTEETASQVEVQNTSSNTPDKTNVTCVNFKNFQTPKQKLRTRFQWKSNKTLSDLQCAYFGKLLKNVHLENKHIRDPVLWKTLKIMLNKIGGSVLQSIYHTFLKLLQLSEDRPSSASKRNKKPLQVKMPFKSRKTE